MPIANLAASNLPGFTGVYVFGDSLVDPGNALLAAEYFDNIPFVPLPGGAPTASEGYFQGRFTDGYNFADLVSNKLLLVPTNSTFPYGLKDPVFGIPIPFTGRPAGNNLSFAYGGAQADGGVPIPDLDKQTDAYRNFPSGDPGALHLITIGGNDVRELVPTDRAPVVGFEATARLADLAAEIADEVGQLFQFGARHILWTGIPNVGLVPEYHGSVDEAARRSLATEYAQRLDGLVKTALDNLALPEGSKLYSYSLLDYSTAVFTDPAAYRFTDLTQARTTVQSGALDPTGSGFLFFDKIHPSAQAHAQVAAGILDSLAAGGPVADSFVPLQPGPGIVGEIEGVAAVDGFTTSLVAGQSYVFDLFGVSSGAGALADPSLSIADGSGSVMAQDDDSGLGLDAHLEFTAPTTGTYAIQVAGVGATTGSYVLQGPGLTGSNVRIEGGALDDTIAAMSGGNYLRGNDGADSITGGSGFDDINGNVGNDTCSGGAGDDWVVGGKNNDSLFGGDGGDIVYGNLGDDNCNGGVESDIVRGGQGNDSLNGESGDDWLSGDLGNDTVTGGAGGDIFHTFGAAGLDQVTDFRLSEGDRVQLDPGTQYALAQVGADTVVSMTGGGQMVLVGVTLSSLTGSWIFGD
jgi:phospholipase/lecithinase/hemolysin